MHFEIPIAWECIAHIVVAFRLALRCVDFPSAVVAQLVHKAILHCRLHILVNPVTMLSNVIFLLDMRVHSSTNANHPEKLVDVITRVARNTTVDNQHIVHIKSITNFKCLIFWGGHSQADCRNVCVIPSVIVN